MDVFSAVVLVLSFASIAVLAYVQFRGPGGHDAEDEQRAFFDEHGRWPDEPEEAAVRRDGGYGDVDQLPGRDN